MNRWTTWSRAAIGAVALAGAGALGMFALLGNADAGVDGSTNPCIDDDDDGGDDNGQDSGFDPSFAKRQVGGGDDQDDGEDDGGDDCPTVGGVDVGGLPDAGTDDGTQDDDGRVTDDDGTVGAGDGIDDTGAGGSVGAGGVEPVTAQPTFTG
jgi:hypothetical protein